MESLFSYARNLSRSALEPLPLRPTTILKEVSYLRGSMRR